VPGSGERPGKKRSGGRRWRGQPEEEGQTFDVVNLCLPGKSLMQRHEARPGESRELERERGGDASEAKRDCVDDASCRPDRRWPFGSRRRRTVGAERDRHERHYD